MTNVNDSNRNAFGVSEVVSTRYNQSCATWVAANPLKLQVGYSPWTCHPSTTAAELDAWAGLRFEAFSQVTGARIHTRPDYWTTQGLISRYQAWHAAYTAYTRGAQNYAFNIENGMQNIEGTPQWLAAYACPECGDAHCTTQHECPSCGSTRYWNAEYAECSSCGYGAPYDDDTDYDLDDDGDCDCDECRGNRQTIEPPVPGSWFNLLTEEYVSAETAAALIEQGVPCSEPLGVAA